jgi:hypothetical protein
MKKLPAIVREQEKNPTKQAATPAPKKQLFGSSDGISFNRKKFSGKQWISLPLVEKARYLAYEKPNGDIQRNISVCEQRANHFLHKLHERRVHEWRELTKTRNVDEEERARNDEVGQIEAEKARRRLNQKKEKMNRIKVTEVDL